MGQRRDTGVARHAGGWIVLGGGLLAICLVGAWTSEPISVPDAPVFGVSEPDASVLGASEIDPSEIAASDHGDPQGESDAAGSRVQPSFPKLRVDINQADEAELSCIEGIGPALAHRIVEHRQHHGQFRSMAQVDDVPGVGPQLIARLRRSIQPLPETLEVPAPARPKNDSDNDSEIAASDPARLVRRNIKLPINESPE